jgi:hypothetical protein
MADLGLVGFAWSDCGSEAARAFQALIAGDLWGFLDGRRLGGAMPARPAADRRPRGRRRRLCDVRAERRDG